MNNGYSKTGGYALISGSLLAILTMGLHPAAGNFEHLRKIIPINITAHSLGILAMLFLLFGFLALKKVFTDGQPLSSAAFIATAAGLCSGILAATFNGLALSIFINQYQNPTPEMIESLRPVIKYNFALNHAFDYIMIAGINIAILLWGIIILKTKLLSKWLAYYGFILNAAFLILVVMGIMLVDLHGFRIFVLGIVSWIVAAGWLLKRA